jgi:hypothetical protein
VDGGEVSLLENKKFKRIRGLNCILTCEGTTLCTLNLFLLILKVGIDIRKRGETKWNTGTW